MQALDDIALLREYTEHDSEEAFAVLVARHVSKVYSVALRHTRNPLQAEEIAQAVFVILAKKARNLGKGVVLSGWLCQTARLTAVTFLRGEIHRARRELEAHMQSGVMHLDEAGVETWEATSTRVVLKLAKTNDAYRATTDWIGLGRKDVPMGKVVYAYPSLRIERNPRETWNLTVNAAGTEMALDHAIHFIQPDPVVLKRTATPDPVPERLAETAFTPRAGSDLQGYLASRWWRLSTVL